MVNIPLLNLTFNASGAYQAGKRGDVVVIVDVVDMSTTAESIIEAGAINVYGVAPKGTNIPVETDYKKITSLAVNDAKENKTSIVLVAEPRIASDSDRKKTVEDVIKEIEINGIRIDCIVANQGIETSKLTAFSKKVAIIASQTGGSSFDAAINAGASKVLTGTVVRTMESTGYENIEKAAIRAIIAANKSNSGITVVAATANSFDDNAAAQQICYEIIRKRFLSLR